MKLNLGCGKVIMAGYVNVDMNPPCDMIHDLETPWPWYSDSVDEIVALDILEHMSDTIRFLNEAHRVLAVDGRIHIRVPRADSKNAWLDPTHKRCFWPETFMVLDPKTGLGKEHRLPNMAPWDILKLIDGQNIEVIMRPIKESKA
jgi:SAM-dependent methyltransferase